MAGIVTIPKVRQIAGGVLGEQSKALQAIRDALEGMKGDFPIKIVSCGNNSFKITCQSEEGTGGSLDVAGTPGLFKVVSLVGWTLSSAGTWTQMTIGDMVAYPPDELWDGQTEAGNYLRPTWDYVRAYGEA